MENMKVLEKNFGGPNSMWWRGLLFNFNCFRIRVPADWAGLQILSVGRLIERPGSGAAHIHPLSRFCHWPGSAPCQIAALEGHVCLRNDGGEDLEACRFDSHPGFTPLQISRESRFHITPELQATQILVQGKYDLHGAIIYFELQQFR